MKDRRLDTQRSNKCLTPAGGLVRGTAKGVVDFLDEAAALRLKGGLAGGKSTLKANLLHP